MHFKDEQLKSLVSMLLGEIYRDCTFDNYTDAHSVIPSIKKAVDDRKSVYLFGDSRTGKTHLAAAIIKYIGDKCYTIYAQKCILLDNIISDYQNENRMEKIDMIKCREILILDDIGVGKLTPERQSMYYYIIDHRISNGLQTIYTSNYKTHDLWNGSTDEDPKRLITRIREMCTGIEVKK